MPRERIPSPDPLAAETGPGLRPRTDPEPDDPQATRRYSLLEHTTRCALVHELAGRDDARRAFVAWEDQLHQRQAQAVADVWRRVGRYLLGSGLSGERDWGPLTWRRLYLTEVAPWTDYTEGDEYRFLGMPAPER